MATSPPSPDTGQPPRAAASLLVVRMGPDEPAVLMARRSASHRFMPNVMVFPGGAVDPADHHAQVATPLRPDVRVRLERSASPSLARALGVAAARELVEEVGLSLGTPPSLGHLEYLCRAVTPPDRRIRFDARFFIVDAAQVSGVPQASPELEDPAWYFLAETEALELAQATRAVLGQFRRWLTHHDRDGGVPVLQDRVWTIE
jgi:8-oxo-dGTP pyrophosphatase MutT (NUDIX family)